MARDLDLTESALRNWVQQAPTHGDARNERSLSERQERLQLRKENRVLRRERELLKKFFLFINAVTLAD